MIIAYASWLKQVPWMLIGTLTFCWRVSDRQAEKTFDEFINRLEHLMHCDIGYVRGDEKRYSGCGKPASARHFHVLFISAAPLNPAYVEALWMSMAGNRSDGAGALVKVYDSALPGVEYVLKLITQPEGDWKFRNLELFHPEAGSLPTPTLRFRRHLRRHKARQLKHAALISQDSSAANCNLTMPSQSTGGQGGER